MPIYTIAQMSGQNGMTKAWAFQDKQNAQYVYDDVLTQFKRLDPKTEAYETIKNDNEHFRVFKNHSMGRTFYSFTEFKTHPDFELPITKTKNLYCVSQIDDTQNTAKIKYFGDLVEAKKYQLRALKNYPLLGQAYQTTDTQYIFAQEDGKILVYVNLDKVNIFKEEE